MCEVLTMLIAVEYESLLGESGVGELVLLAAGVLLTLAVVGVFGYVLWRSREER